MHLIDLVNRTSPPIPWAEGDNIPWNDPVFSQRMLREHLSQAHDAASRRFEIIDRQVEWIHSVLLGGKSANILDLTCGPGFYCSRLSRLGYTCHGIDYSPASIEYAIRTAGQEQLSCQYTCRDIRQAEYPPDINLVMLIYGEFNVFRPSDAGLILDKIWQALAPCGVLLLEPHPYQVIKKMGEAAPSWYSSNGGLFSEEPYIVLHEYFWDETLHASTIRYMVIDSATGQVTRYAQSMQAYTDEEYRSLLASHGFRQVQLLPGLLGKNSPKDLIAVTARK
jgi:SAM-dependent methyltransferase